MSCLCSRLGRRVPENLPVLPPIPNPNLTYVLFPSGVFSQHPISMLLGCRSKSRGLQSTQKWHCRPARLFFGTIITDMCVCGEGKTWQCHVAIAQQWSIIVEQTLLLFSLFLWVSSKSLKCLLKCIPPSWHVASLPIVLCMLKWNGL